MAAVLQHPACQTWRSFVVHQVPGSYSNRLHRRTMHDWQPLSTPLVSWPEPGCLQTGTAATSCRHWTKQSPQGQGQATAQHTQALFPMRGY
jgi:hypothetical protein